MLSDAGESWYIYPHNAGRIILTQKNPIYFLIFNVPSEQKHK